MIPDQKTIPTKAAWLKSILCSYTHKNVIQNANLSNLNQSHFIVRKDDTIVASNKAYPSNIVHDIMHDYNRVIRQILIDDHVKRQSKLYKLTTNEDSTYECPTNQLQETAHPSFNTTNQLRRQQIHALTLLTNHLTHPTMPIPLLIPAMPIPLLMQPPLLMLLTTLHYRHPIQSFIFHSHLKKHLIVQMDSYG